jgi:hypothetical protein
MQGEGLAEVDVVGFDDWLLGHGRPTCRLLLIVKIVMAAKDNECTNFGT